MKIGIFGGSFDPVHNAHINMAKCAMEQAGLNKVIFVPNGNPPHKTGLMAGNCERLDMLKLAIHKISGFEVSDYEIKKEDLCYTVDTMRYFKKIYPDATLMFIVGADSLDYIHKWNRADELKSENTFIAVNRSFDKGYNFKDNVLKCRSSGWNIITVDMPFMDVSSTNIRNLAEMGQDVSDYVPQKVAQYIKDNKVYLKLK